MASEPPVIPVVAHWAAAPRPVGRGGFFLACLVGLVLLAAWAVPPLLDWGRFRTTIAAIAATRLGRPVVIGGEITLRLLPQPALTASDVTLPDQGDGISVQVAALRLQVAPVPLLAGHFVPRDLVLGAPVLRLPWHLPAPIAHPARPEVPHAFAARIEGGTLLIGQAEITGITASIHGGPAAASGTGEVLTQDAPAIAAFAAEGFAQAGGRSWRFTAALGAPDADGVSAIDVSVRGQGVVGDTEGTVQATLADELVQGRLRVSGRDLSQLMPAAALPWQADAPFTASADRIEARAIALSLGGAPADGALSLHLGSSAALQGHLHAESLDLDGWAALLGRSFTVLPARPAGATQAGATQAGAADGLNLRVELAAETARLLGGDLHGLRATLVANAGEAGFQQAEAVLPGGARLTSKALRLNAADGFLRVSGRASLEAPDLRATLAWLRPLAPTLIDEAPAGVLRRASVSGDAVIGANSLVVSGLSGSIDGSAVSGGVAVETRPVPRLEATVKADDLALDPWLGDLPIGMGLAGLARGVRSGETILHLAAPHAVWRGLAMTDLALDASATGQGLSLRRAEAGLAGAKASLSGRLAPDGRISDAHLTATTADLARLVPFLPAAWRRAPGLWSGPASLALAASGPPEALEMQMRADAGDLVLEAESRADSGAGTATATLTLRHPGAPRLFAASGLLASLGLPVGLDAAYGWLDTGSLALRSHLALRPGHLEVRDFDLNAAALRVSGSWAADWSGRVPALDGVIAAEVLALPAMVPGKAFEAGLAGWDTHIGLSARSVLIGLRPVARDVSAELASAGGVVFADRISADVAGGRLSGQAAADSAAQTVSWRGRLDGAVVDQGLTGWPVDLVGGKADVELALWGSSERDLSGSLEAGLSGVLVGGFDLAALSQAGGLRGNARRVAARAALTQGASGGLSGEVRAEIAHGRVALTQAALDSVDGKVVVTGGADLAGRMADFHVAVSPETGLAGRFALRVSGPFDRMVSVPELSAEGAGAVKGGAGRGSGKPDPRHR